MVKSIDASIVAKKWLTNLRVLRGIPFQYLVPAEAALPPESIRFFHVDRNWIDAVVDGALSIAMTNASEYAWLNENYPLLMSDLNTEETRRRGDFYNGLFSGSRGGSVVKAGGSITGMLMRSSIVRDYPGLEISAYIDSGGSTQIWDRSNAVQVLRMERLSDTIMLLLFNGKPTHLRLQEPSEGIRMGVDGDAPYIDKNGDLADGFTLKIKNEKGEVGNFDLASKPDTITIDEVEYIVWHQDDGGWGYYTPNQELIVLLGDPPSSFAASDPTAAAWIKANATPYVVPPSNIPIDIRRILSSSPGFSLKGTADNFDYVTDVIDIKGMYEKLASEGVSPFFGNQDSALIATQMLQYPYQQDFVPFGQMELTGSPHPHKDAIHWDPSSSSGGSN